MKKNFNILLKESFKKINTKPGSIIKGTILLINKNTVLIDSKLKSESLVPINQFYDINGNLEIKVNDKIDFILDIVENGFGETILSRDKAKKYNSWLLFNKIYKNNYNIKGKIIDKVKGGFTVDLQGIRAFLPGSLTDVKPIRDGINLEKKNFNFKIVKLDEQNNNIIVSRRAVLEIENNNKRNYLLENLKKNKKITGIVKNLTDYGVFIDLGGIDGLLHITDISWKRIKHPNEIVNIGDEIKVSVLSFDYERNRVSLGLKQLNQNPWNDILKIYPKNTCLKGKITKITNYGCFVSIGNGFEGLVHTSELNWLNKNNKFKKKINIGNTIKIVILEINKNKHRISLGIKQCLNNSWNYFKKNYKKGICLIGKIKLINNLGIFINFRNNINGLIHYSDILFSKKKNYKKDYKKNNKLSVIILQIDIIHERLSLGIKKIIKNNFYKYIERNKRGSLIVGKINKIFNNWIEIKFKNHIKGILFISEIFFINFKFNFKINKFILLQFTSINFLERKINLSICSFKKK